MYFLFDFPKALVPIRSDHLCISRNGGLWLTVLMHTSPTQRGLFIEQGFFTHM